MFKKNFKPFRDRSRGGGTLVVFQSQRITDLANGDDVVYSDTTLEKSVHHFHRLNNSLCKTKLTLVFLSRK